MAPLRVIIADDHPVVRAGLCRILERTGSVAVVAEAADGRTLLREVRERRPDVVLVDLSMPELNGIDATRLMRRQYPATRVLVISVHCTEQSVVDAIEAGASGYLLKDAPPEDVVHAVRAVADGMGYFSPPVARLLANRVTQRDAPGVHLSPREREVVQLLGEGRRIGEIAARLFISAQTVKTHRANAMRKLGSRTTAELIRYAIVSGLAPS